MAKERYDIGSDVDMCSNTLYNAKIDGASCVVPKDSNSHTHGNRVALDKVSGENTGDQSSSDFDIKDLSDTTNLRSIWSDKQDALTFSTNIETDKASTTKVSAIKTFYDWAVGKFIDLSKIVTTWTATTLNTNIPSEKLVKDNLDLKADIIPSTGATSALRAIFIARGATYHADTGLYSLHNGLVTNITEAEMTLILLVTNIAINMPAPQGLMSSTKIRTHMPMTVNRGFVALEGSFVFQACYKLEVVYNPINWGIYCTNCYLLFHNCFELHTVDFIHTQAITSAAQMDQCFFKCFKLATCKIKGIKVSFSWGDCPLITLESLQYLITNRANGTTRITITVHATVWAKLNDAVGYPTWNALLVDAVANQYIDFASA